SRRHHDVIVQDPDHVPFTGLDPLVPGLGASQVGLIANDRDAVYRLQVLRRAVRGGIVHDDNFTHFVGQAQHGLQTLHGVKELVVHGNDETDAGQRDHNERTAWSEWVIKWRPHTRQWFPGDLPRRGSWLESRTLSRL